MDSRYHHRRSEVEEMRILLILLLLTLPAQADVIKVDTAAGPITVSPSFGQKIKGFIADVVARGYKGYVHCFAKGGHVRGSRHYSGNACDFAQTGWGKTVAVMYHVRDLAEKYGLRDGCSFKDCGHIDDGGHLGGTRYASRHHTRHAKRQDRIPQGYAEALPSKHGVQ